MRRIGLLFKIRCLRLVETGKGKYFLQPLHRADQEDFGLGIIRRDFFVFLYSTEQEGNGAGSRGEEARQKLLANIPPFF